MKMAGVKWTKDARARLSGSLTPHPLDKTMTAADAWGMLVERDRLIGANRSFPLGVPAKWAPMVEAVIAGFASKEPPTNLTAEGEVFRTALLDSSEVNDPLGAWLASFWVHQGGLPLLGAIDGLALPLFASTSATRDMVARKNKWVWTGAFKEQRVVLAPAKGAAEELTVTLTDADGSEDEQQISRLPPGSVDWSAARRAMLSLDAEAYARRESERPVIATGSIAKELRALAGKKSASLSDLTATHAARRRRYALLFTCARDTKAATSAVEEILAAAPVPTQPLAWWLVGTSAWMLLPNLDDLALATRFNELLSSCAHVCAGFTYDVIERFGRDAAPLLQAWLPGLKKYRDEKALVTEALKLLV